MKKLLSLFLIIAIIICAVPLGAFTFTVSAETEWGYTYTVSDDEAKITDVDTSISGDITIPSTLGGYPVTSIGNAAFYSCSNLTSITIPNSVTSIGGGAFRQCSSLTSITIPNSVTSIGENTFRQCSSLTSITIPDSVTDIGTSAFYLCTSLTSITIPNSVTSIGENAFWQCSSLTSITIPEGVTNIGQRAFYRCTSLETVNYNAINCITMGSSSVPVFESCEKLTTVNIGENVTSICDYAFYQCTSLTSITIPSSVTSIGGHAFHECTSLTSITIPDSVTDIGTCAFYLCTNLTSITIPNSVTYISRSTFNSCYSLTSITIPNSVTNIGNNAFYLCRSLVGITIPNSVTNIGNKAFYDCKNLTDVWYEGCGNCKANISIGTDNDYLSNSTWHYYNNYSADCDESCNFCGFARETNVAHIYDGDCDAVCDTCGSTRTITHTYDNACDAECNICGDIRVPSDHVYDNVCDAQCNICGNTRVPSDHVYDNTCDASCNICGDIRVPSDHIYDNTCDAICNVCDASRTITHTYDNACDAECNICGNIRITSEHVYDDIYDTDCNVCGTTRQLTSISISVLPSKIVYAVGEAFDNSGMVVNAHYSDGASGVITRYAVVGFDSSTAGTKIVNVTYGGRITQFAVTILALEFSGASLTLQNDITINYMVDKTAFDNAGYTNPYVEFEFNGAKTIKRAYSTEDGMYIFRFNNIIPSQINDIVKATLYAEYNGIVYSGKAIEYSVAKYCYTMLSEYAESDNTELKTLLVDLLNYGAAAQIYTDYNTASLANSSLTDQQAAWGTDTAAILNSVLNTKYGEIENPAVKWKSAGLNLKDSVSIRLKITAESCDNLMVKVKSESGQEWMILGGNFEPAGNGCYYVYFENLSAHQMREEIYVTVYDGDTAVSNTLCYSIESYAYAVQSSSDENLKNLLDAMIKYGDSAYNYKQSMG